MTEFIDNNRESFGVESICRTLQFAPTTYRAAKRRQRQPPDRALSDAAALSEIRRVHADSGGLYGSRKVFWQLRREGHHVAKCTVERLMAKHGLSGVVRGKRHRTTVPAEKAERPVDLLDRDFTAPAPNRKWVADFTYVLTWSGVVYVAFVIDCFSRRIVGWKADRTMQTSLVLDTLEMAIWSRERQGLPIGQQLIHHHDNGSQYLSFAFTSRLIEAGIEASVGSVGDGYDNALAESTIGLFKTEKIGPERPWRTLDEVEFATLEWVDWYNNRRLHGSCDRRPPAEYERLHLQQLDELISHNQ